MKRDQIIEALREFKEQNQSKYRIIKIGLFGSTARNGIFRDSDLDIVVLLERQDLFEIIGIKQDLEEQLSLPVDIISYRKKMNAFLKRRIDAEAVYV